MTITLELKPNEIAALQSRAQAECIDMESVLHSLIARMPPPAQAKENQKPQRTEQMELSEKQQGLANLLQSWREEDKTDDPEVLAERDRELEEFKANMNRWRAEEGRGPVYP